MTPVPVWGATLATIPAHIARFGSASALIAFGGNGPVTWTFTALSDAALRLATGLRKKGLRRGDAVAVIAAGGPAAVVAILAAIAAGGVAVPLDPELDDQTLARMVEDVECRFGFVAAKRAPPVSAAGAIPFYCLDGATHDRAAPPWTELLASAAETATTPEPGESAVIVYTSGTTGTPKAVPLTHTNIAANVAALLEQELIGPGDRAVLPLPLFHVYPLVVGLLTPLLSGASVVFPAGLSGPQLAEALRDSGATHLVGVPRMYTALVAAVRARIAARGALVIRLFDALLALSATAGQRLGLRLGWVLFWGLRQRVGPKLRLLVSGGAALDDGTRRALAALGWEVLTGYGLTETSPILTFDRRGKARPGTAGQALPGVAIRIAAPDAQGIGEIEVRGPSVFAGYRGAPDATRAASTPDGWFRTGDLGFLDPDAYLHVAARVSETIVLAGGTKLFPEAVEEIYARDPVIREIALLVRNGVLVALAVPGPEALRGRDTAGVDAVIRAAIAAAPVAPFQRPAGVAITPEPLPRTRIGKIRRHLLPVLYERARAGHAPQPGVALAETDRDLLAHPAAARLWTWLQQRFPEARLTLDSDLRLDLGIDSLTWLEVTLDIESALSLRFDEATTAQLVTVRDMLAAAVAEALPARAVATAPIDEHWLRPLPGLARSLRALVLSAIRGVVRALFAIRVQAADTLPRRGPYLICPNHASYLDPFVIAAALPHEITAAAIWAGWTGILFNTRARRLFSRLARVVPVDPLQPGPGLALAVAALRRGQILIWFPEGARSRDGGLQPFLPGVGALLREVAAPVVPIFIDGTHRAWPPERRLPRPVHVSVRIGAPLPASELIAGNPNNQEIANRLRAAVAALASPATYGPSAPE